MFRSGMSTSKVEELHWKTMSNLEDLLCEHNPWKYRENSSACTWGYLENNQWYFEVFGRGYLAKVTGSVKQRIGFFMMTMLHHSGLLTHEFLHKNNIVLLLHLSYSPGLAFVGLYLLPKRKMQLKSCFNTVVNMKSDLQKFFDLLRENNFQAGFQEWQKCWDGCITVQGDYIKEDDVKTWVNSLVFFC